MLSAGVILTIHHTSFFLSFLFPWDFSPDLQLEFNRKKGMTGDLKH